LLFYLLSLLGKSRTAGQSAGLSPHPHGAIEKLAFLAFGEVKKIGKQNIYHTYSYYCMFYLKGF